MPLQYGLNINKSDMMKMLEQNDKQQDGVRTWRKLFGYAGLGANAQSDAITSQYTDAIAQAYKANFEQQNAMYSSGLGSGAVKEALALTRQELQNTYANYLSNYQSNMGDVQEAYSNEVGAIQDDLETRAQNFADLYNSAYTYLSEELFGAQGTELDYDNMTPIVEGKNTKDPKVTGYAPTEMQLDYMTEHGLDWLKNEDGTLKSWAEIGPLLLAEDGTFSEQGRMFFDQMFNASSAELSNFTRTDDEGVEHKVRGFDEWLSEYNPELRDWWASGDSFNYNFAGSNAGSAKAYAGMDSTDVDAERLVKGPTPFKGQEFDTKRSKQMYSDLKKRQDDINYVENEIKQLDADYNSRRTNGGLTADFEREYRTKRGELQSQLQGKKQEFGTLQNNIKSMFVTQANEVLNSYKGKIDESIYNDLIAEFGGRINALMLQTINEREANKMWGNYKLLMQEIEEWVKNYKRKMPNPQKASGF